jgi:hypothetical protein
MAKVQEEIIVIKISKLVKDSESGGSLIEEGVLDSLEAVAQELLGSGVIVEVEKA